MDKSSLALIYSRKKLPCDNPPAATQLPPPPAQAGQQQDCLVEQVILATVEYVIQHHEDGAAETASAVTGISGDQQVVEQTATICYEEVDPSGAHVATYTVEATRVTQDERGDVYVTVDDDNSATMGVIH